MKLIFSVILTLTTLLGGVASWFSSPGEGAAEPSAPVLALTEPAATPDAVFTPMPGAALHHTAKPGADYAEMAYEHYDETYFLSCAEELSDMALAGDEEGAAALCELLYSELEYIDDMLVLAMIRAYQDIGSSYWAEEYSYTYNIYLVCSDALSAACADMVTADMSGDLAAYMDESALEELAEYEPYTEEELSMSERELALTNQYQLLFDGIDELTFSYEGRDWTLEMLYGFPGAALAQRDWDGYLAVYNGLQQTLAEQIAPVYAELIELWKEEAITYGYDSYIDYAYEQLYNRAYGPEDAQRLCDAVKPIAREYYANLYYADIAYAMDEVQPVLDGDELLQTLGAYLPRVDESLLEPYDHMLAHGLHDLTESAPGRYNGSFTCYLPWHKSPFLYATLAGDSEDMDTLAHEFGHYAEYYFTGVPNALDMPDDLDLCEVASNALQGLFSDFYGEIYGDGGDVARFTDLSALLTNILDGCMFDEFQRRILEYPDELTPESINRVYCEVSAEYGLNEDLEWDSTWLYISHNFEQPLYYFSYAASAMAAVQIWDIAQSDFDAARSVYMDVLMRGAHDGSYFEVLEDCGLRPFTDEDAAETVCRHLLDELEALDSAYYYN